MRISTYLFFFLFIGMANMVGQQLIFYRPDNLKNLPSAESYNIMQDSKGYIWFSTDAGLCRYNGKTIKVFSKNEGLPEESCYAVTEDASGTIWMMTSQNRLLVYNNDTLKEHPSSKKIEAELNRAHYITNYLQRNDSVLWLGTQRTTFKLNLKSGDFRTVLKDTSQLILKLKKAGKLLLPIQSPNAAEVGRTYIKNNSEITFLYENGLQQTKIIVPNIFHAFVFGRTLTVVNLKGEAFFTCHNMLIKIKPDLTYEIFYVKNEILNLYCDASNGIWCGVRQGGLYYFPDSELSEKNKIQSLVDLSVSGICEDKEKGMWCTTLEEGVFYCSNKNIVSIWDNKDKHEKNNFLKCIDNRVYFDSKENYLNEVYNGFSLKSYRVKSSSGFSTSIFDILRVKDGWVIGSNKFTVKSDVQFNKFEDFDFEHSHSVATRSVVEYRKRIFTIHPTGIYERTGNSTYERNNHLVSLGKNLLITQDGKLIAACNDGLYEMNLSDYSLNKILGISGITKAIAASDNSIWVLTKNSGIFRYVNNHLLGFEKEAELSSLKFRDIVEDKFHNIWLATNAGVIKLSQVNTVLRKEAFNISFGLPSDDITHISVNDKYVYFSTSEGLYNFPIESNSRYNIYPPTVYINTVWVNKKEVEKSNTLLSLNYNENNIKILADVLAFKNDKTEKKIIYQLIGLDAEPHTIANAEISLNNLPPGEYELEVYALNENNIKSARPALLKIVVDKPFWFKLPFIVFVILAMTLLILLVVQLYIKRIRKKEAEKTRMNKLIADYHMSALRAQMNPHFIFNCINSIQRYILTNKTDDAYTYLAKFSKLIRLVLNYSEENTITLAQELEIVDLYMQMEQLRFENVFQYEIICGEELNSHELYVPSMLMQPYIENAIWHGIMHLDKEKNGYIKITLSFIADKLIAVIEDNGVGRERAAALSAKTHKSKALSLNNRRIEILNTLNNNQAGNIIIEDITGAGTGVEGTRVTIIIPQQNNHE